MSLYEQFFSDINKDFMFNMANNVLQKDHNIIIEGNVDIKEEYLQDMKDIFENNDFVEISHINKELLDLTIKKNKGSIVGGQEEQKAEEGPETNFSGYRKTEDSSTKVPLDDNEKKLADLMKERDSINNSQPDLSESSVSSGATTTTEINTETNISDLLKNTQGTTIEGIIEEQPEGDHYGVITDKIDEQIENSGIKDEYVNTLKLVSFTSNKRTSINSSRYNYSVDLNKAGINPTKLHSLSRLIIPIEDNYIFTLPILTLVIKELDMEVCLQQKEIIKSEYNTVGIYEPIENIIFNISYPLRKLSIDIRDMSNVKFSTNDILKINIMEVKKNILIFTCSKIDMRNFKMKDMIKIINIQTYDMYIIELLSNPLKIKAIKDNMIFCHASEGDHPDRVFTNIDMKILNISNQNMIYFNQYS